MDPFRLKIRKEFTSKKYSISGFKSKLNWEEGFLDAKKDVDKEDVRIGEEREKRAFLSIFVAMFVSLFILVFGLANIQIVQGENYQEASKINRIRRIVIDAPRGIFYDRNEKKLVENVPSFDVVLIPGDLLAKEGVDADNVVSRLSALIGESEDKIKEIVAGTNKISYSPVLVKENVDRDIALKLEASYDEVPGFQIMESARRKYYFAELSHVLGYVSRVNEEEYAILKDEKDLFYMPDELVGKTGIEKVYEKMLRGYPGLKEIEVNSAGFEKDVIATKKSIPGESLILSIDLDLQTKLAENVNHILSSGGFSKAAAVALNPQNGEVLAMVSMPSFDNNLFSESISPEDYAKLANDPNLPMFNRVIGGTYASGSVIKPVIGAAALEESVVTPQTTIVDTGKISIQNVYYPDIFYDFYGWKREGLGPVDIYRAIAYSSNPYFFTVGGGYGDIEGLGPDRIAEYLLRFGFGEPLGIDLPSEKSGLVPTVDWKSKTKGEKWSLGDTYNISIGQGDFLTTPLQIASAISSIANRGTLYKPSVVKSFKNEVNGEKTKKDPEIIRENMVSKENFEVIRRAMYETVYSDRGSGRSLSAIPVKVAAKTGTAQFQGNSLEHSWFVVFGPYENPSICLAVLIEQGGSGAESAAIVARDTLNWYFSKP